VDASSAPGIVIKKVVGVVDVSDTAGDATVAWAVVVTHAATPPGTDCGLGAADGSGGWLRHVASGPEGASGEGAWEGSEGVLPVSVTSVGVIFVGLVTVVVCDVLVGHGTVVTPAGPVTLSYQIVSKVSLVVPDDGDSDEDVVNAVTDSLDVPSETDELEEGDEEEDCSEEGEDDPDDEDAGGHWYSSQ
jgi:hypothetical protein